MTEHNLPPPGTVKSKLLAGPELWSVNFDRVEAEILGAFRGDAKVSFELSTGRLDRDKLAVELVVRAEGSPHFRATVVYRAAFQIEAEGLTEETIRREFRLIAAHVAPAVVYPYARETLASVSSRAAIHTLHLPLVRFSEVFKAETVEIPEWSGPAAPVTTAEPPAG